MPRKETLLAQIGLNRDDATGSICTPVYHSATYRHPSLGESTGYDYARTLNPTRKILEESIAAMENGTNGHAFSSGMAALTAIFSLFTTGDHFIVSEDLYGGTFRLIDVVFRQFGFSADFIDTTDLDLVKKSIKTNTKAILIETPSNPLLRITDIRGISNLSRENNLLTIIDNTFMTPYLQRPLDLGADLVVHSGTKYLGGHNDVLCGLTVSRSKALGERIGFIQNATGGVLSAQDSFLMLRGIKTLSVRIDRAQENSSKIAQWLNGHSAIKKVYYPELPTHSGRDIHLSQSEGFGAMISFRVKNAHVAEKIINSVKLISFAESLGGVESLITYPIIQTHGSIPEDMRNRIGVTDSLLRLSVGIEHVDDLIADLSQAIEG